MPKIRQYTANITPSGATNVRNASAADFGGLEADALMDLGQSAQKMEDKLREVQERREQSEYERMMAEHKLELAKKSIELSQAEIAPGADMSQVYGDEYKALNEQLAPHVPVSQRRRFEVDSARLATEFQISGLQDGVKRQALRAATNYENTLQTVENTIALNPTNEAYVSGLASVMGQLEAMPTKNGAEREAIYAEAEDRLLNALTTARIVKDPDQFIADAQAGKYDDVPDLAGKLAAAERQKKANEAAAKKALLEQNMVNLETQLDNEAQFMSDFDDPENTTDFTQRIAAVNEAEFRGEVRKEWAVMARRFLGSQKELNAVTDNPLMADVVLRMHDLVQAADFSPGELLEGRQALQMDMLQLRADGKLSREDYKKLHNTFGTLLSSRTAEATKAVAFSFGRANDFIQSSGIPPQYHGTAIRDLFYATRDEKEMKKFIEKGGTPQDYYMDKARRVVDAINQGRRYEAVRAVKAIDIPSNFDEGAFLDKHDISEDDLTATAKANGMTRVEVIKYLRENLND